MVHVDPKYYFHTTKPKVIFKRPSTIIAPLSDHSLTIAHFSSNPFTKRKLFSYLGTWMACLIQILFILPSCWQQWNPFWLLSQCYYHPNTHCMEQLPHIYQMLAGSHMVWCSWIHDPLTYCFLIYYMLQICSQHFLKCCCLFYRK